MSRRKSVGVGRQEKLLKKEEEGKGARRTM